MFRNIFQMSFCFILLCVITKNQW